MPTYDIIRIVRNVERYTVAADTMEAARRIYDDGNAVLKEDETTDVHEVTVIDRATEVDVTIEFFDDAPAPLAPKAFDHVTCDKIRAYLTSNESTTLDLAGNMIDAAARALNADEISNDVEERALMARQEALESAEAALGARDSIGVRAALREFWSR